MYDRALKGVYPSGSTIKPFMAMAALNTGKRAPGTIIHDGGTFQFGNHTFRSHGDHGLKIPGYQVATDAAPQLRLAAFTQPYLDTTGFPNGWKGVLFPKETVEQWIGYAYAKNIQLFLEYDPAPPFPGGHPRSADAKTLAIVKDLLQKRLTERDDQIRQMTERAPQSSS